MQMNPSTSRAYARSNATLSRCGQYRYDLVRIWDKSAPLACFIMLNPSTADASRDDPTIRRCVRFAASWGCGGMVAVNLFALRATSPGALYGHRLPVGPRNDAAILRWASAANVRHVVCAWGAHGSLRGRGDAVAALLGHLKLEVLGLTRGGAPRHPLYLAGSCRPVVWCGE